MEGLRITTEQISADNTLLNNLNARLADWKADLQWTERQLMQQSIADENEGHGKSPRYLALETNQRHLTANIANAEGKLQRIQKRESLIKQIEEIDKEIEVADSLSLPHHLIELSHMRNEILQEINQQELK